MDTQLLHQFRFIPVIALLALAAALLRRSGEPPVALKGLRRVLYGGKTPQDPPVAAWRRVLAFLCVLSALALAFA